MSELEQLSESLVLRVLGVRPQAGALEAGQDPRAAPLERLFREIGTYLEFVAIARGH